MNALTWPGGREIFLGGKKGEEKKGGEEGKREGEKEGREKKKEEERDKHINPISRR